MVLQTEDHYAKASTTQYLSSYHIQGQGESLGVQEEMGYWQWILPVETMGRVIRRIW